jgi:aminoglycoside 6'-N-acetyltransferase I
MGQEGDDVMLGPRLDLVDAGDVERGNVHLQPDRAPDLYIDNLGTSPARQRRGIAAAMIKALIEWGKGQGCTFAWVATETDNDGAIGFYGAQNFTHDTIALFAQELD